MGYLLDDVTAASFKGQQDVVRNERRQRVENAPFGIVQEAVTHLMYPKEHPYYGDVIGSHSDIQAAQLADVKKFFKQYYGPNNATLALVGDIKKADALKLVEKYFGAFKKAADIPPVKVTTPAITEERRLVVKDRIELPRIYMAWRGPAFYAEGDAEADLLSNLLGGDKVSRLYKSLVYEKQIAQDVTVYNLSLALGSVFMIQATAAPNHTLEELEKAIDTELDTVRATPPSQPELTAARNTMERGILFSLEQVGGIANRLNLYNHYVKNPDYLQQDVERYRKATPESIKAFAAKYLTKNARVVVHGVQGEPDFGAPVPTPPKAASNEPGESIYPDEEWRAMPPKGGPEPALVLPSPQQFQMANGLTVILDSRKVPTVAVSLTFRGGLAANPASKPGLGGFMLDMLDEGTATLSTLQFSEKLKEVGAEISESPARDASSLIMTTTRGNTGAALDLLADAVMNPAFKAEEVDRVRKRRLGELTQQKEDPGVVSDVVTLLALNGKDNPYGYTVLGNEASVKALTVDDLKAFWKSQATPANAAIIVSGDFTKGDLQALLDKSFGKWPKAEAPTISVTPPAVERRLVLVDAPGAPQTMLRAAIPGPMRNTPDYEPLLVMNEIMGGAFSSRINLNLRERNGFTYGASARMRALAHGGWFVAASPVRADVTGKALAEMVKEIKGMSDVPVTAEEMTLAKSSLVRTLPSYFETTSGTVSWLSEIPIYNLSLDYYTQFTKKVDAVPPEKVQEAAKKHLLTDKMLVVAVGDLKKVGADLKALDLGKVEVRDADGAIK